ncbi:MAG: UPF0182 family membrane protein [Acidimicrobiales bacterium]
MRPPTQMPRRQSRNPNRGRIILVVVLVALFFFVTSLRGIAGFYTDYLWFDALDLTGVWTGVLGAQIALAVIFTAVFFALMWVNLWFADRLAPRFRPTGPEEELLERYHEVVGTRTGLVRIAVSGLLALIAGLGTAGQWNAWILFTNRQDFGRTDPLFDTDIGFYVFQLPFLSFVANWFFWSLVFVFIITAAAHYINGGIRLQISGERVTPQVKGHLSVLLGAMALVRAGGYWLDRYELTLSQRGHVDGALYTDVNAQLPAIQLLLLISLFAAALFIYNIRRRGWVLPVVAVGLWAFVSIVVSGIYPAIIQRFQVEPAESSRESEFIERNIEATRFAMGLDTIDVQPFDYNTDLDADDILNNQETIRNIRLLDPEVVDDTYQRLQADRGYYRFNDLDVDRYMIDGQLTQVVLGARELNPAGVPIDSWEGRTLVYTHGYGVAMAPASAIDPSGRPNFVVGDLPVRVNAELDITLDRPELYFGENLPGYAIVGTDRREVSFQPDGADTEVTTAYEGEGGVPMGSLFRRVAFALRFGEIEPVISNFVRSDSQILYIRDVRDRVRTVAPFISFDDDPYAVVNNGGVVYVVDGYTTTDRFPYSQRANLEQINSGSGLNSTFNYVRNSVKAVVDAYDGTVVLYVIDDEDPIVAAYAQAFPELFAPMSEMPDGLVENLRYPEDLFTVQTNMWGRYFLENPQEFYAQDRAWQVAQDPGATVGGAAVTNVTNVEGEQTGTRERRIDPYYLLMRLPEQDQESFVMLRPFVPISQNDERKELISFMVVSSDPDSYGDMTVYTMPSTQIDGPAIVNANILSEEEIATRISLLNREGSSVLLGNLTLVPIEQSILYVRPLYVQASGQTQVPELRNVIVAYGNEIVMEPSLAAALERLFGVAPDTGEDPDFVDGVDDDLPGEVTDPDGDEGEDPDGDDSPTPPTTQPPSDVDDTVEALLASAEASLTAAEEALREGDLGEYQRLVRQATQQISRAQQLLAEGGGGGSPPTTAEVVPTDST